MMEWDYDNSCTRPPSFSRLSYGDLLPSPLGVTQHAACSRLMLFVPSYTRPSVFFLLSFIAAWQMALWIRVTTVTQEESSHTAEDGILEMSVCMNFINDWWNLPLRNGATLQDPRDAWGSWRVGLLRRGRFQLLTPCNSERGHLKMRGRGNGIWIEPC